MEHWADHIAHEVEKTGVAPVISTGISPSGEIHIGNMREVLTADAVYRALKDRGVAVRFNYVADNFDPLRKVYPFLDEKIYQPCVGQPLSDIPCPCEKHDSYSDHFLEPFLSALDQLQVEVEVVRADQLYKVGRMNRWILKALEQRDTIAEILTRMTKKPIDPAWSPFHPWCPECRILAKATVKGFSTEQETVTIACPCGFEGDIPLAGGGKLIWRIDWPARWCELGVTVEPFGKDHATQGGSYDTGKAVVEAVFEGAAPYPIPYEWIRLKGKGDMSSSKGNVLSIGNMLEVVPPEILRYLVIRTKPQKTIMFDPGLPLLQLADEYESAEQSEESNRAVELSKAAGFKPVSVPFKHLVVVAQIANFDLGKTEEILSSTGFEVETEALKDRLHYVESWLHQFAPEDLKFELQPEIPEAVQQLSDAQRTFLGKLADSLEEKMEKDAIHQLIYDQAKLQEGMKPAEGFAAVYLALLGKKRGPRAGGFVASVGIDFCKQRFAAVAELSSA